MQYFDREINAPQWCIVLLSSCTCYTGQIYGVDQNQRSAVGRGRFGGMDLQGQIKDCVAWIMLGSKQ